MNRFHKVVLFTTSNEYIWPKKKNFHGLKSALLAIFQKGWNRISSQHAWNASAEMACLLVIQIEIQAVCFKTLAKTQYKTLCRDSPSEHMGTICPNQVQAHLWACGRGNVSTPIFVSHLNPISTREGRLCPSCTDIPNKF